MQNSQTLQGYIFLILQHFATKLCNFTNFRMLFNAVVWNFPTSTFFKILSIMQSVHYKHSLIYFILLSFATKVGSQQHHIRITLGPHYLTHPVHFPCGKRPEYLGKNYDFLQSVDVLYSMFLSKETGFTVTVAMRIPYGEGTHDFQGSGLTILPANVD